MLKRVISILLSVIMTLGVMTNIAFAKQSEKYIVILFDVSGSMDSTAKNGRLVYENAEDGLRNYCNNVLNAQKNTKIALVPFDNLASVASDFTNDINEINIAIDKLRYSGGTNHEAALVFADKLLSNVSGEKEIILFTDGIPNDALNNATYNMYYDKYPSVSYYTTKNATATVDTAKTIHNKNYYVRTLGYFSSSIVEDQERFAFVKEYLSDLANPPGNTSVDVSGDIPIFEDDILEEGDYFQLGNVNGNKLLWRIIDITQDELLLMPVSSVAEMPYDVDSSLYSTSDINNWLNTEFLKYINTPNYIYNYVNENNVKSVLNRNGADLVESGTALYIADNVENITPEYDAVLNEEISASVYLPDVNNINSALSLDNDFYMGWKNAKAYLENNSAEITPYALRTPYNNNELNDEISVISNSIQVGSAKVTDTLGIRPVLSIKCDKSSLGGTGEIDLPYYIYQPATGVYDDYDEPYVDPKSGDNVGKKTDEEVEYMLGDINNQEIAEKFMIQVLGGLTEEEKEDNIDLLTVLADEVVSRAADIDLNNESVKIDDELLNKSAEVVNSTEKSITKILNQNNIKLQRNIRHNVRIVGTGTKPVKITKSKISDKLNLDNVIVTTGYGSVEIASDDDVELTISDKTENATGNPNRKGSVIENTSETTTLIYSSGNNVENKLVRVGTSVFAKSKKVSNEIDGIMSKNDNSNSQKIQVKFNKNGNNSVVKVKLFGVTDAKYKAVVDENGQAIGGKYNVITGEISAKTSKSGIYSIEDNEKSFEDIKNLSADTQQAILELASKGILYGTAEEEFSPEDSITRAQVAAIILRTTNGYIDENVDGGFIDVPKNSWFFNVAGMSKRDHIIEGYEDNTFRGNNIIPFEQIVSVTSRTLKNDGYMVSDDAAKIINKKYSNIENIDDWAIEDVALAIESGIITLSADGVFDADAEMTRGDAAVAVYEIFKKLS